MERKEKIVVALLCIALIYMGIGAHFGNLDPREWPWFSTVKEEPTVPTGMFDLKTKGYNSLDIATGYTVATNYNCYWYANRNGWIPLATHSGSSPETVSNVELAKVDAGYIYAVVEIPSGQSFYVDFTETKLKNPRVVEISYDDPDGDGYNEFIFKFNMFDISKPASGNPSAWFYVYLLPYEKPSINTPSDITSIGTAKVTKYIEWYLSFTNQKKAWAVSKVELIFNTSDTTKITLKHMNIPSEGYYSGDSFSKTTSSSEYKFTYEVGTSLYTCSYLKYGTNQLNKFELTTELELSLASGDVITAQIKVYALTVTGALETVTDTVVLSA